MNIQSKPFRMDRKEFARIATLNYVKKVWPLYLGAILAGIVMIALNPNGLGLIIGLICILYPLTVPWRYSNIVAMRSAKFLQGELNYTIDDDEVVLRSTQGGVTRGELAKVESVAEIAGSLVFNYGRGVMIIVPLAPIEEGERAKLRERFVAK